MTTKYSMGKRITSVFMTLAILLTMIPMTAPTASAAAPSQSVVTGAVADPGTADTWEQMMGSSADGNRYAGRVWVDKSVYKDGDTAVLNSRGEAGSSFEVSLEADEAFQVIFSAVGSSMTTTTTISSTGPMDVVLVLDTSTSMDDESNGVTRLQRTIEAANSLIDDLLTISGVRIAIVTYNRDSETVLPLARYANGINLVVTDYYNNGSSDAGVVYAYDDSDTLLGSDSGYTQGTNLQAGIDRGFNILANATDVEGRIPVAIVLTDGQANRAEQDGFYNLSNDGANSASGRNLYLSTLLNAAYNKTKIEENYHEDATVYTVGVDVSGNTVAQLLMDPANTTYGFKDHGTNRTYQEITYAYRNFQTWAGGQNVTYNNWTFDHNYPTLNGTVTREKIAANIYYADTYYPVDSADLQTTFDQIFKELTSGVFNPISDSTTIDGATGVDNTPLLYVDWIGQYMEVKEIEAVTLFGASYSVINNGDGTYTVATGTGTNPATREEYNTSEDIVITVTEAEGVQKLEIKINQEILPIMMEQVISKTVGNVTTATITEVMQEPLRVYYTVGIDSDILLANGEIDISKIQGYEYIDDTNGTVSFYSNRFGVKNVAKNDVVTAGDAHVGFKPSAENRYYYHQANQRIFSAVTNSDGSAITWDTDMYGVLYKEGSFNLTDLDYATYLKYNADLDDANNPVDHQVYTYVSFYRPTADQTDAADAAELVTYLVYTNWSDLRESVSFYDATAQKYVNYSDGAYTLDDVGYVMTAEQAAAYVAANSGAELYAVLGMGSLRTSRFHNMIKAKTENLTGTATLRYDPEYTYGLAADHNNNDVVVWLGNNGRLTVAIDTGIALTKNVTETIGNADDTYALTVTVPSGVTATPNVTDENGNDVTASISTYLNNVLTVNLKAGQTVYISGIPGGTVCAIGENIPDSADYYIASKTETVTVPTVSEALNGAAQFAPAQVTNAPNKYGNLYITKEVEHSLGGGQFSTNYEFEFQVTFRDKEGNLIKNTTFALENNYDAGITELTTDEYGVMTGKLRHGETVYIKSIPAGATVSVKEVNVPKGYAAAYESIDYSGAAADSDGNVTIYADRNATVVATNTYTPDQVSVDIGFSGTKIFDASDMAENSEFTFKLQEYINGAWADVNTQTVSVSAGENANKPFSFNALNLSYTQPGVHSYQIIEVHGGNTDITYDRSVYTFSVNVTLDSNGDLVAEVAGHNTKDGSFGVTGDSEYGYTVTTVFTNYYHKTATSIEIIKAVNSIPANGQSPAGFVIETYEADENWSIGDFIRSTVTDAQGKAMLVRNYDNTDFLNNDTDGDGTVTYRFIIKEKNTGVAGWTYDETQYRVTVVLTKDATTQEITADFTVVQVAADGTATNLNVTGDTARISFVNTYVPDEVTVSLDGQVAKELTGKTLTANMFTFYVFNDGEVDRSNYANALFEGTNNLNGEVKFVDFADVLTFDTVGKYEYDIVELIPEDANLNTATGMYELDGMSYDSTIYDLVVEVTLDAANGKLVASYYFEDAVGQVVTFRNKYEVTPTSYQLGGLKTLNGRAMQAGEFSFGLYQNGTWIETVTNKADGSFTFSAITYTQPGIYTYTIEEIEPATKAPGVTYDDSRITVGVTVTDDKGVLRAAANVSNTNIRFENTYVAAPVYVDFEAHKTLKGKDLQSDMFFFGLYATDSSFAIPANAVALAAVDCNASGVAELAAVKFEKTGTYFFTIIEETENPIDGIVYDTARHNYIVTVRDHGAGKLEATVQKVGIRSSVSSYGTVSAPVANFENATFDEVVEKEVAAKSNPEINIDGEKVNEGELLTYFITYTNYTGKAVVVDIMDTIPEYTSYVEGSASHNGSYAGTHILWTMNVADGESVTVTFDVRVDETQVIVTNTAVIRDGVNTYTTNEVVNHTVDEELVKDVFSPDDITVSIDGNKVYSGDELLYKVSFINATADTVNITITDRIPTNTTYVAESADNGGVYSNGQITWTIDNVPAWQSVTVSFKVKVDEGIGAVTVENKATATDGTNSYETNTVSNYTVEDEVEKKVFAANNTEANIDGRKVYEGDELVYTISYKNTADVAAAVTITDAIPQYTTYVDGSASEGGIYENGIITWTEEVAAGGAVTVSFKVTVNTDIGDKPICNEATVVEGKNSYTTNEVTNYTVEDEVEKNVFFENSDVSIDGRKVYPGDVLVYAISYKNTAAESATVTITDRIPEFTEYVADSADNGGVYDEGVITWTNTVDEGDTFTVSFKVKVQDAGNAEITNQADVWEGKNSYTTNEVTNYTVDDEVGKDVFSAEAPETSIDGRKVYAGDTLVYEVSYSNTDAEQATVTITDAIPAYTVYVDGSASNGGVYNDGTITWTLDVEAGATVTVSFKVTVEAAGNVTIANKAEVREGRNTYYTNEVTNYTVDDDVEKKVFNESDSGVSIDGGKVYIGDTLIYSISYTNSATEKATVKITDTIPEYTAYVDGSADNGGVCSDGVITWNLEVEPGATVTVTFKVAVKENAKTATIANEAVVQEGRNTYYTNEVTNYTTEDEVEKNVFSAEAPSVSIDGQEVACGDTLIYAISYRNTSSEKVTVTIMDTVPDHTSYVAESADNGGVYQDGVITWTVEVEAGGTAVVSFQARVAWVQSATITNKATVLEGRNTYTTNEVSNPTSNTVPDIPKTGDETNLALWVTLMLVSGGAAITLGVCDKKKRRLEEN